MTRAAGALAFARLDLQSWLPRAQTLLPLALVVLVAASLPIPGLAIVAAAIVTSMMVSAPFLADERGGLDTLYGLLPVSRSAVVAGRAVAILAYAAIVAAVALVTTLVGAVLRGAPIEASWLVLFLGIAFGFVGLALTIQLPVLFAIGYARGRLISYAPAFVVAGGAWLAQQAGILTGGTPDDMAIGPVVAACVAVGLVGVVAAIAIAARTYRAREIR